MTLLGIKLKQTQQLNQRLQQSLRVLQMSGIELEREVENWLSDNPLLERKDTDEFSDAEFSHYTAPARQIGGDEGEDMLSNIAGEPGFQPIPACASMRTPAFRSRSRLCPHPHRFP